MSSKYQVIMRERIHIQRKIAEVDDIEHDFTQYVYNESMCERCPEFQDRHSDSCDDCAAFQGVYKFFKEIEVGSKREDYMSIPIGTENFEKYIKKKYRKKFTSKEKRIDIPFKHQDIKFTGKLHKYQKVASKAMRKAGGGVLVAPPRSGKTVMGSHVALKKKKRTLFIASQSDWLDGFYETLCGSDTQPAMSNIPELEEKYGYKICVFAKTEEDFLNENHDIVLATYQTFLSKKGKRLLKKVAKHFSILFVDECDLVPATEFSRVFNSFHAMHRYGCTGTPDRKDGKYIFVDHLIGKVQHTVEIDMPVPTVSFIETGVQIKHNYKILAYSYRALDNAKGRNEFLAKWAKHDVDNGHLIVIPTGRVDQCHALGKEIGKLIGHEKVGIFSRAVLNNANVRKQFIQDARSGKYKVVIGIRKMIQRGINVPAWSMLYEVTPISNPPNFQQETRRILTPMEGKKPPEIRFFLDDFGFSRGCLATCLYKNGLIAMKFNIPYPEMLIAKKYVGRAPIQNRMQRLPGGSVQVNTRQRVGGKIF